MDLSKEPKYNKHDYAIFESIKATFSDENLIDFTKKSTLNIVEIGCGKELHYTGLVLWNLALCGFKNINLWLIEPLADSGEQNLRYLKDCFPDCNFHRVYSDWQSFQSRNLIEYSDITYTIQVTTTIPDQKLKNLIKNHRNRMHSKSLIIDISETNDHVTDTHRYEGLKIFSRTDVERKKIFQENSLKLIKIYDFPAHATGKQDGQRMKTHIYKAI